jgi:arylsulfatase A-like enzyme
MRKAFFLSAFIISIFALIIYILFLYYHNSRPNIIVIVLDATRPDHLSCYGYNNIRTPNIDNIARKGIKFTNALSTSCWTVPAISSLFTSLYPISHGCHAEHLYLQERNLTLAEILRQAGYFTAGFISNGWLHSRFGFNQGFQLYDDKVNEANKIERNAINTNKAIKAQLRNGVKKPFFLFVHYIEPHIPYFSHPSNQLSTPEEENIIKESLSRQMKLGQGPSPELINLYDGEIAFLDYHIGELLKFLNEKDMLKNTIIILTADHGEFLGEHDLLTHCFALYDQVLKVPLIISYPTAFPQNETCHQLVSINDILPTILDACGIKFDGEIAGKSLLGLVFHKEKIHHKYLFAEYYRDSSVIKYDKKYYRRLKAIISNDGWKLIFSPEDAKVELYNRNIDPWEQTNLAEINKEKKAQLLLSLDRWMANTKSQHLQEPVELEESIKKKLKALGYLN